MQRDQVYGRRPVREALRGRRQILELWASERALAAEPWLRDAPLSVQVKQERALSEAAARATTRACSRGRSRTATPMRGSSRRRSGRCSSASTASPTRATSAPSAARRRRGRDRRRRSVAWVGGGDARGREGVGRRRRAPAGRVSSRTSRATCRRSSGADLWIYAAAGDAEQTLWETDFTGGTVLVLGAEGKGLRPLVRRSCDAAVSIPLAGGVESLNVSVAAALLLYEARRQRG